MDKPARTEAAPRDPDAYERSFMSDKEGQALARERMPMPTWMRVLLPIFFLAYAVLMLFALPSLAISIPIAILIALLAVFIWSMTVLRVSVTETNVHVQNGPFGPKIPIEAIERCEPVSYSALREFGGWGIRYGRLTSEGGTWCYNVPGDEGKAVEIHYRDKKGKKRKVMFSSARQHVLADAINRRRRALGHAVPEDTVPDDAELGLTEPWSALEADQDAAATASAAEEAQAPSAEPEPAEAQVAAARRGAS